MTLGAWSNTGWELSESKARQAAPAVVQYRFNLQGEKPTCTRRLPRFLFYLGPTSFGKDSEKLLAVKAPFALGKSEINLYTVNCVVSVQGEAYQLVSPNQPLQQGCKPT